MLHQSLVICDIDGCLNSGKAATLDLQTLASIRMLIAEMRKKTIGFTLCTGRPQPYAEAFADLLDVRLPLICENGGLIYDRTTNATISLLHADYVARLERLKSDIARLPGFGSELHFEPGKVVSASLTGPKIVEADHDELAKFTQELKDRFAGHLFHWTHSTTAIDITLRGTDKASGVKTLLRRFPFDTMVKIGVGDSAGDIPFLKMCDRVLVPSNASTAVQKLAQYVSPQGFALGTLDILQSRVI